jgi:hypothetical protein
VERHLVGEVIKPDRALQDGMQNRALGLRRCVPKALQHIMAFVILPAVEQPNAAVEPITCSSVDSTLRPIIILLIVAPSIGSGETKKPAPVLELPSPPRGRLVAEAGRR